MRKSSLLCEERAQGATEYMVIIGGIILIVVIVSLFIKSQFAEATKAQKGAGEKALE